MIEKNFINNFIRFFLKILRRKKIVKHIIQIFYIYDYHIIYSQNYELLYTLNLSIKRRKINFKKLDKLNLPFYFGEYDKKNI